MTLEIRTERLRLRPLNADDFELFCQVIVDDPVVMEFYHKYTRDLDAATRRTMAQRDFFDHFAEGESKGYVAWAIFAKDSAIAEEGSFLGWCGITTAELNEEKWGPEIQYMLASSAHGKGVATEAARAVFEDAKSRLNLPRLHAVFDTPNVGSRRVVEKLGFVEQGGVRVYDSDDMQLFAWSTAVQPGD